MILVHISWSDTVIAILYQQKRLVETLDKPFLFFFTAPKGPLDNLVETVAKRNERPKIDKLGSTPCVEAQNVPFGD